MRWVLAAIVTALLAPAGASAAGETSIFYYPWWGTPKRDGSYQHWSQDGHVPPGDIASTFYPARGVYSSSDWNTVRKQMKEIAGAGIREVVSSWWGRGSVEDKRLPMVMHAAWKDKLDVAVQLEPYDKLPRTPDSIAGDLAYLRETGINRIYVYGPFDGVIDDATWRELTAAHPDLDIYAQTQDVDRAAADGFDGIYTYDVFGVHGSLFASLCARAHAAHLACAPSVGPGYNATRATGDDRVRRRRDGATYDEMWQAAIAATPDRITITSYNEWHEGTQIEPAAKHREPQYGNYGRYANYEGAYGRYGKAAQTAYLVRTAYWTKVYRLAAAATRAVRLLAGLFSP